MGFQAFLDIAVVALRFLLPVYAVVIIYQCFASMRRHRRPEKPLVTLEIKDTGEKIPVLFWENSIGRSKGSDICVDDPTVSRDHCVLLRRQEGWMVSDIGSKGGTYVNGKRTHDRTQVLIDDEITVGSTTFVLKRGDEFQETLRPSWFFSKASNKGSLQQYKLMLLITFFHLFMTVEACFTNEVQDFTPFTIFLILEAVLWTFFFVSTVILKRINFELEAFASFLTGIGVLLLVRQHMRSAYVQLIAAAIGMVIFCILVKFIENPDRVNSWRMAIMIGAIVLFAINIVFGKVQYGAANWISIGGITIQPSEFVKIAYIFVGAAALDKLQTRRNFFEFLVFSVICVGALALMGDFGTALIFFATFLLIAFMRSGDIKTIMLALVSLVFAGTIVLKFKPYVVARFSAWRHVWENTQGLAYQQARTLTYTASGGLCGVGVGNGFLKYVGASESDLVFGLVSEELGVIISFSIALALVALAFYARAITTRSRSTFYAISACCAAGLMIIQSSLNVFGSTDILPLTGVTLPFISAGGSSMISCWGLLAFIKAADERTYAARRLPRREIN